LIVADTVSHDLGYRVFLRYESASLLGWHEDRRRIYLFKSGKQETIGPIDDLFPERGEMDLAAISLDGERLFFARHSNGHNLAALNMQGTLEWMTSIPGGVQKILPLRDLSAGLSLAITTNKELITLDRNGHPRWQFVPRTFTNEESFLSADRIRLLIQLPEWQAIVMCSSVDNPTGDAFDESGDLVTLHCIGHDGIIRWQRRLRAGALKAVPLEPNRVAIACGTTLQNSPQFDCVVVVDYAGDRHWENNVDGLILCMYFDSEAQTLSIVCDSGRCYVFDMKGKQLQVIDMRLGKVSAATFLSGQIVLASGTSLHLLRGIGPTVKRAVRSNSE
jgi:hypothetical protein